MKSAPSSPTSYSTLGRNVAMFMTVAVAILFIASNDPTGMLSTNARAVLLSASDQNLAAWLDEISSLHRFYTCKFSIIAKINGKIGERSVEAVQQLLMNGDNHGDPYPLEVEAVKVPCTTDLSTRTEKSGCCVQNFYLRWRSPDVKKFDSIYNHHNWGYLYSMDQSFQPKYILDAGANAGWSSIMFKYIWPNAVIIAMEPDPINFAALIINTKGIEGIQAVNAALWNKHTRLRARKSPLGITFQELPVEGRQGVLAYSVEDIAKKWEIPAFDMIRINVPGSESTILGPGSDAWLKKVRLLAFEVSHSEPGTFYSIGRNVGTKMATFAKQRGHKIVSDGHRLLFLSPNVTTGLQQQYIKT